MDEILESLMWFGLGLAASAFIAWFLLEWLEGGNDDN